MLCTVSLPHPCIIPYSIHEVLEVRCKSELRDSEGQGSRAVTLQAPVRMLLWAQGVLNPVVLSDETSNQFRL